ncbi:hypothetical protein V8G54_004191, partial [Vigna mungo]
SQTFIYYIKKQLQRNSYKEKDTLNSELARASKISVAMERKTLAIMFFFLLVLTADVCVKKAEADCYTPSAHFKGACFQSDNCNYQCTREGHPGGECQGFIPRRCMCIC